MCVSLASNTMKQRDKKTENIKTKGRRQSASTTSFPHDLILQILLRLPAKSVVRFRCVSKLWSSSTSDNYFTKSFETQSSIRPSLLMFFKIKDRLFVFSFPNHYENSNVTYSSKHVYGFHMTYPKYCCFSFTESVHGLICFQKSAKPIIWNPTMRQFTILPKPEKGWKNITMFLGYDPTGHKHKVMCLPRNGTCDECRVLTLGSTQETWRTVITNHRHRSFYRTYGRCINGVVYYPAYLDQTDVHILMSFDVRHEKFDMIEFPPNLIWSMMIPFEGRLACVKESNNGITLWILESPEKHRWSSRDFLAPFAHYDKRLKTDFKLDGITHAGEFIYVPSTFHKSFYILYFDSKRNIFRKVKFEGIAEDEFRLNNGLGNKRMNRLHTFQNHIQSLMSS